MSGFLLLAGPRAEALGLDGWSLTFLLFGGVVVACRVVFARVPDRLPPMALGSLALALVGIGLALAGALPGVAPLLAGSVVLAVGVAFMTPALFAATFNAVPPSERGAAAGTGSLFIDLGFGVGPLLAGLIAADAGIGAAFAASAGVAAMGALGAAAGHRITRSDSAFVEEDVLDLLVE
jgi:MFS family permease